MIVDFRIYEAVCIWY